jgi:peroxygenase
VHGTYLAIWQTEEQKQHATAVAVYLQVPQLPSNMAIRYNIPLTGALSTLTGDNPATTAFESARVREHEVEEQASRPRSRPPPYIMLVGEKSKVQGTVEWIAGVGDVCRVPEDEVHRARAITPQHEAETKFSNLVTSPRTSDLRRKIQSKRTALQRHCDFWDADGDGLIFPWDIYTGFRKLGFNIALCLWAAISMPICCSYSTQTSWLPHPLFVIRLSNIHRSRHGSTTATYDMDAEIDTRRFNAIFDKYANGKDYLTLSSLYNVWAGQCCANDWFGWFAGGLECECLCDNFPRNIAEDMQGSRYTYCYGLKMES